MNATEAPDKSVSAEINELLQVRLPDDENSLTYPSRVEDLLGAAVVIAWPTHAGALLPAREQQRLSLCFIRQDAAYLFEAVVEGRKTLPLPQLILRPLTAPRRIQRRQYFRVKAAMSVELNGTIVRSTGQELIHLKTRTHDISGSGMAVRHSSSIPPGTVLETKLVLPGELPPVRAVSRVVHSAIVASEKACFHVGMHFLTISEADRTRIVRHVFRIQQSLLY